MRVQVLVELLPLPQSQVAVVVLVVLLVVGLAHSSSSSLPMTRNSLAVALTTLNGTMKTMTPGWTCSLHLPSRPLRTKGWV